MLRLLDNNRSTLVAWAEERIGCRFFPDAHAIGWGTEERIKAVTVYDRWSDEDCHIHLAGDGQFGARKFLAASYFYPFVLYGRRRITGLVPSTNERALRLNFHMGFKQEGVLRHAAPDGHIIVLGMLREECRFLPIEHRGVADGQG